MQDEMETGLESGVISLVGTDLGWVESFRPPSL